MRRGSSPARTGSRFLLPLALAVLPAVGACDRTDTLTPDRLKVEIRSFRAEYEQGDTFRGSFTITNKTLKSIRAKFPDSRWFDLVLYDSLGNAAFHYNVVAFQIVTYLELDPLDSHTEMLSFPPDTLPVGAYRVHGWVMWHEDIWSETTIQVLHR